MEWGPLDLFEQKKPESRCERRSTFFRARTFDKVQSCHYFVGDTGFIIGLEQNLTGKCAYLGSLPQCRSIGF